MFARLLLAGMLTGGTLGGFAGHAAIGQEEAAPFDWGALLGGAVGSSPATAVLLWRLNKADKETAGLRDEVNKGHAEALSLTREIAPLLANAVETLDRVKGGLEATLDAPRVHSEPELERILRRIERTISDLADDGPQRGRRD